MKRNPTRIYDHCKVVDGITNYIVYLRNCGIIDDRTANFLLPPARDRTQQIYFLPKLHKNPISFRLIVSGCSGPTEAVSAYINYFLQPYMRLVSSYIKNSAHLINIVAKREFSSDCRLVTLDVSSLYTCTNISHEDALNTLDLTFENEEVDSPYAPPLSVLKTLLKHVLENNIFSFNGQVYQQRHGVAMGTKVAPALATLFLHFVEQGYLSSVTTKPSLWLRYIDDILCIREKDVNSLSHFIEGLNVLKPRLHFLAEISTREVIFFRFKNL